MSAAEVLFPAVGLLLFGLGRPLALRRIRPNRWYGLRVPATFADEQVWYDANAIAGRDMMALGVVVLIVTLALPRVAGLPESAYQGISAALVGLGSLVLAVRGWLTANRMLRQRREQNSHRRE
jgi:uncharacterized membrane protein